MRAAYYSRAGSYSRSYNAEVAEDEGRLPMTRAIPVVREAAGCTVKEAREALNKTYDGEWHHVGKYARRVEYYDTDAAIRLILELRDPAVKAAREAQERAEYREAFIARVRGNLDQSSRPRQWPHGRTLSLLPYRQSWPTRDAFWRAVGHALRNGVDLEKGPLCGVLLRTCCRLSDRREIQAKADAAN